MKKNIDQSEKNNFKTPQKTHAKPKSKLNSGMSNNHSLAIFNELMQLMPELKKNEDDWREFIENFIEARPDSKIDADFKKELHQEIRKKTNQMKNTPEPKKSSNAGKLLLTFLGGGALTAFVIIPSLNSKPENISQDVNLTAKSTETETKTNLINITKNKQEKAFGALTIEKNNAPTGLGGGMENAKIMSDVSSSRMIRPPYYGRVNYEYVYEGKDLPEIRDKVDVFKKQTEAHQAPNFQNQLASLGINLLSLETFKNLNLENIDFVEDNDLGYRISINFERGNISIHQDYEKWQKKLCPDKPYCEQPPIKKEDIPSDKKLIALADKFLEKHKIKNSHLGTPTVKKHWEEQENRSEHIYYPSSIPVIYPFLVNGQEITNQWGEKIGVRVNINIRLNKVESANFSSLNLESSEYETLTQEALLKLAQEGGAEGVHYNNPERVIKIKLDTPKKILTQMYLLNKEGTREEIYVPALVFPVKTDQADKKYFHQKNIIVPIAKNVMNQNGASTVPPIQPMPRTLEEPMME